MGAASIFWFVQSPDSIVNREASKDSIARERAALVLECLKETDPTRRRQALAVVRAVYGRSEDSWLETVELALQEQALADAKLQQATKELATTQDPRLRELYQVKKDLAERLDRAYSEYIQELNGTGGSRSPGSGPLARVKLGILDKLKSDLAATEEQIRRHQQLQQRDLSP